MHHSVGIRSLAVSFPSIRRTNHYYREKYPQLIKEAEQKSLAKLFSPSKSGISNAFDREMLPYLSDPFRGTVERRVLDPRETSLELEYRAARDALDAARLGADEVDLMLVASTLPEQIMPGNAVFLADQLGLGGAAWNLESTGANTLVALQNACALIRAEEYRKVLVVISTTYSRLTDSDDTLSWFTGDGAGAFVVSSLKPTQGTLGTKIVHTAKTCGAFYSELTKDQNGNPRMFLRVGKNASKIISDTSTEFLHTCCKGAAAAANVTLDQIDFFAFNTPTAWYSRFCIHALGSSGSAFATRMQELR